MCTWPDILQGVFYAGAASRTDCNAVCCCSDADPLRGDRPLHRNRRAVTELALPAMGRELGVGLLAGGRPLHDLCILILMVLGVYRVDGFNDWHILLPGLAVTLATGVYEELVSRPAHQLPRVPRQPRDPLPRVPLRHGVSPAAPHLLLGAALQAQGPARGHAEGPLFRGGALRIAEQWLGTWAALAVSALVFGFVHMSNDAATLQGIISISTWAGHPPAPLRPMC